MNKITSNFYKFFLRDALYSLSLVFTTGAIIQTFLNNIGLSTYQIGIFTTAVSICNVLTTVLLSNLGERTKSIKKSLSICLFAISVSVLGFLPFCFTLKLPSNTIFLMVTVVGCIQALFIAIKTIFEFKLPYQIIDINSYDRLVSINGIIMGIVGMLPGFLISESLKHFAYLKVMFGCFLLSVVFLILSVIVNQSFIILSSENENNISTEKVNILTILKLKQFSWFILPNLTRGVSMGTVQMAAVIGIAEIGLSDTETAYMSIVVSLANLIGSIMYVVFANRVANYKILILSSLLMILYMFVTASNSSLFLIIYFLTNVAYINYNYAVPSMIYKIIPFEIAGIYNAWRMILTTITTAASTSIIGHFLGKVPAVYMIGFATICQLFTAICYLILYKKFLKLKTTNKEGS